MQRVHRHKLSGLALSLGLGLSILIGTLLFMLAETIHALPVDPTDISFEIRGTEVFTMDHNGFCNTVGLGDGPDALWLPVRIRNNHLTDTATGLQATLSTSVNTIADDPIRYIGNLGPGQFIDIFFMIDYSPLRSHPNCDSSQSGANWYNNPYSIQVDSIDSSGSLTGPAVYNSSFSTRRMISASAGGVLVFDQLGPGVTVGQVMTQLVEYRFGNNSATDILLQPAGNGGLVNNVPNTAFRDDCFRLIGSRIISSDITQITAGTIDQLFFLNATSSNNYRVRIEYQWFVLCSPGSPTLTYAWATMISGNDYKYNESNYRATTFPLPNPVVGTVSIDKTVRVPPDFVFGVTDPVVVTYTVEVANAFSHSVILSNLSDQLAPMMSFVDETATSDIDSANSSISPAALATGLLDWYGVPPDIHYKIPANSSIFLIYNVSIDYDETNMTSIQYFTNTVTATVGSQVLGPVSTTVEINPGGILSIGLRSFGVVDGHSSIAWLPMTMAIVGLAVTAVYLGQRNRHYN